MPSLGNDGDTIHSVVGETMDIGTLEEHAASVGSMIADLDAPGGYGRDALEAVHHQTELLAKRLLAAGEGTPALKKEIFGWVLRLRNERARPTSSALKGGTPAMGQRRR
ncbi:hypothetical protein LVY72_23705 [Arthrobacter sp. I2-34]|uniref:Uncharacterized protein n=1 Tax=Arthrobacter hankyongi TaxID=2904801 RepID=A0ABS9LE22_9MICC|nr:hypothetical protein [Arthrobacter hankyongi]MCG2624900.1 hypothetical protein [Arthrobacter hankyongi]